MKNVWKKRMKNVWKKRMKMHEKIYAKINEKMFEKIPRKHVKNTLKNAWTCCRFTGISGNKLPKTSVIFSLNLSIFSLFIPSFFHCLFIIYSSFFHSFYLLKFWHLGLYSGHHSWTYQINDLHVLLRHQKSNWLCHPHASSGASLPFQNLQAQWQWLTPSAPSWMYVF